MNDERNSYIQQGDIIVFDDKHYLLCGDSTKESSFDLLKEQATMVLTSPPYNVGQNNYGSELGKSQKYLNKKDDIKSDEEYLDLLSNVLNNVLKKSKYVFFVNTIF